MIRDRLFAPRLFAVVDGVGSGVDPAQGRGTTSVGRRPPRGVGGVPAPRGPAPAGGFGTNEEPVVGFDPVAAITEVARGAAAPPPSGLSARLMEWASPPARQFETVSPARLLPLLALAVDRLADAAHQMDELGELGAVALERELRDHQVLAERRATMIET